MSEVAHDLVRFLATTSLMVLVLAVVAAMLIRSGRLRGKTAWAVLATVLALPFLFPASRLLPDQVRVEVSAGPAAEIFEPPAAPPLPRGGPAAAPESTPPTTAEPAAPPPPESPASPSRGAAADWREVAAAAWLAVVALLAARLGHAVLSLRQTLRRARPVRDREALRILAEGARELGLASPPRLLTSAVDEAPFVTGLGSGTIVMPERLLAPGRRERLRLALLHELAHVKGRHGWWMAPEQLLRIVYFFHPPLRWVLTRLREERECLCDRQVMEIMGGRSAYATFLLEEFKDVAARRTAAWALGVRSGSLARRVRRIVEEGSEKMNRKLTNWLSVALSLAALTGLLALGPAAVRAGPDEDPAKTAKLDNINASPTGMPGVYHVMSVFEKLEKVYVFNRAGPYGKEHTRTLEKGEEYSFKKKTGRLVIKVPVDDDEQMVSLSGVREMPWKWKAAESLREGSVKVLLGDRPGVRGEDFAVDHEKAIIRFLKTEHCDRRKNYYITYGYPDDPAKPGVRRGGSIGNHRDRAAVRRFLGLAPRGSPPAKVARTTVGTGASATGDPKVWTLSQRFRSDDTRVAVAKRGQPGNLRWLTRGEDYVFDETAAKIVFLKDIPIDKDGEFLFVSGTPADRSVILFHRAIERGAVKVLLGSRRLEEGRGFSVDYTEGVVTIHDAEIQKPRARFFVSIGKDSYGNISDRELLKKLFAD